MGFWFGFPVQILYYYLRFGLRGEKKRIGRKTYLIYIDTKVFLPKADTLKQELCKIKYKI